MLYVPWLYTSPGAGKDNCVIISLVWQQTAYAAIAIARERLYIGTTMAFVVFALNFLLLLGCRMPLHVIFQSIPDQTLNHPLKRTAYLHRLTARPILCLNVMFKRVAGTGFEPVCSSL